MPISRLVTVGVVLVEFDIKAPLPSSFVHTPLPTVGVVALKVAEFSQTE